MYCLKLYLLYLIIIVFRVTGKISLLLLTVLPSSNTVITYLLTHFLNTTIIRCKQWTTIFDVGLCVGGGGGGGGGGRGSEAFTKLQWTTIFDVGLCVGEIERK